MGNPVHAQFPRLRHLLTVNLPAIVTGYTFPAPPPAAPNLVHLDWTNSAGALQAGDFGLVVVALGFGEKTTTVSAACPYRGFEFWGNDPFSLPNLGCATLPRVLISGGGDGGLHDFLRIATPCKSAEEIWHSLPANLHSALGELRDAEDQVLRAFAWGPGVNASSDCPALGRVQQCHEQLANFVHASPRVRTALDGLIRSDFSCIHLLYPCTHLSQSYGLNRFLTLLLVKHLEPVRPHLMPILRSGMAVTHVQCIGHGAGSPAICNGQPHDVFARAQPSCLRTAAAGALLGQYDVVIVRHSIEPTPLRANKGKGSPMPPLRQLLPYHLPD